MIIYAACRHPVLGVAARSATETRFNDNNLLNDARPSWSETVRRFLLARWPGRPFLAANLRNLFVFESSASKLSLT
jgi:hypothetical protein